MRNVEPLVTTKGMAVRFNVTELTVRNWIKQGRLPEGSFCKLGKAYRFDMEKIERHFAGLPPEDGPSAEEEVQEQLELPLVEAPIDPVEKTEPDPEPVEEGPDENQQEEVSTSEVFSLVDDEEDDDLFNLSLDDDEGFDDFTNEEEDF